MSSAYSRNGKLASEGGVYKSRVIGKEVRQNPDYAGIYVEFGFYSK